MGFGFWALITTFWWEMRDIENQGPHIIPERVSDTCCHPKLPKPYTHTPKPKPKTLWCRVPKVVEQMKGWAKTPTAAAWELEEQPGGFRI